VQTAADFGEGSERKWKTADDLGRIRSSNEDERQARSITFIVMKRYIKVVSPIE